MGLKTQVLSDRMLRSALRLPSCWMGGVEIKLVSAVQMGTEEKGTAADEAMDWKARATKMKRQALTFKTKYTEAAAARDTALAELQALKEVRGFTT